MAIIKFSHADINSMVEDALNARRKKIPGSSQGIESPLDKLRAIVKGQKLKKGMSQREI